jgi:hypothetical protein
MPSCFILVRAVRAGRRGRYPDRGGPQAVGLPRRHRAQLHQRRPRHPGTSRSALSPGWGDVYVSTTPCNWLDATDVPDGRCTLRIAIDTKDIVDQDNTLPDTASVEIELAGNTVTVLR